MMVEIETISAKYRLATIFQYIEGTTPKIDIFMLYFKLSPLLTGVDNFGITMPINQLIEGFLQHDT